MRGISLSEHSQYVGSLAEAVTYYQLQGLGMTRVGSSGHEYCLCEEARVMSVAVTWVTNP